MPFLLREQAIRNGPNNHPKTSAKDPKQERQAGPQDVDVIDTEIVVTLDLGSHLLALHAAAQQGYMYLNCALPVRARFKDFRAEYEFAEHILFAAKSFLHAETKQHSQLVRPHADRLSGSGMCLKVRDGTARAVAPATLEILRHAWWIDGKALHSLDDLWRPAITNDSQTRVGRVEAKIE